MKSQGDAKASGGGGVKIEEGGEELVEDGGTRRLGRGTGRWCRPNFPNL